MKPVLIFNCIFSIHPNIIVDIFIDALCDTIGIRRIPICIIHFLNIFLQGRFFSWSFGLCMFSVEIVDEDIGVEVGVIVVGVHQPVLYLASAGVLGEVLPDGHPPQAQGQPRS